MSVLTPAGRINKLFGIEGGVMLSLYTDFAMDTPLFVAIDGLDVPLYCERFERRGASGAVAAFADFDTERRARELLGLEFRINLEEDLDDEFYMEDLIGFSVTGFETKQDDAAPGPSGQDDAAIHDSHAHPGVPAISPARGKKFAGVVSDYIDSDANPLLELEIGGNKVLVPAVEEFIVQIDFKKRLMKLVLPEGLLDLQG